MADEIILSVNGEDIKISVRRGNGHRMSLSVNAAGRAVITVPRGVSLKRAQQFAAEHSQWLAQNIKSRSFFSLPQQLQAGDRVLILGQEYILQPQKGKGASLKLEGGKAILTASSVDGNLAKSYEKALREFAREVFTGEIDRWYPLISHKVKKPTVTIKVMTSRWGSAGLKTGNINLNLYLIKAPLYCISSVALHEVAHFIKGDHSREFYAILDENFPQRKQAEEELKRLARS